MFCRQCGAEIVDGAKFCAGCGAAVNAADAPVSVAVADGGKVMSFDDYVAYQNLQEERKRLDQDIAETKNAITYYQEVYDKAKKRLITMPVISFFLALWATFSIFINETDYMRSGAYPPNAPLACLILALLLTLVFSIVMYGLAWVKDKAVERGFWVFGGWLIMAVLFMFVAMVAIFAGIPHFFGLLGKKKDARKQIDLLEKRLQSLTA